MSKINTSNVVSVDWGTSNLRAYLVTSDGRIIDQEHSDQGLLSNPVNFQDCLTALIGHWLDPGCPLNIILSGMVGSPSGWIELPHLPCPANMDQLAKGTTRIAQIHGSHVWIVPGLAGLGAAGVHDVMRGEELQYFGAQKIQADNGEDNPELWCFPGTHNKWLRSGSQIALFSTSMAGELFELAKQHSLLAQSISVQAAPEDGAQISSAFLRGLAMAEKPGGLMHHLFSVRSLQLAGKHAKSMGADYLSGILIGHDILSHAGNGPTRIGVVAGPKLIPRYQAALEQLGHKCVAIDSRNATTTGAVLLNSRLLSNI